MAPLDYRQEKNSYYGNLMIDRTLLRHNVREVRRLGHADTCGGDILRLVIEKELKQIDTLYALEKQRVSDYQALSGKDLPEGQP
jgi:hypothetical protein